MFCLSFYESHVKSHFPYLKICFIFLEQNTHLNKSEQYSCTKSEVKHTQIINDRSYWLIYNYSVKIIHDISHFRGKKGKKEKNILHKVPNYFSC